MKTLIQKLTRAVATTMREILKPYRVVVKGNAFDGHSHRAWSFDDALTWAKFYPRNLAGEITVTTRFGRFVGRVR
ncbi:hypothetical protein [Ensifer sp. SSB1]|uniref:hypothetical protein n=1 Tax=Ensifer sp. SSB1 TaxID=2795385 RepID=UPI001A41DA4C|nr:hypothetical protein [Ensifer sp. SSB1]MBK5571772.1 hypothetical protein [Ensifer sp. SSB1]